MEPSNNKSRPRRFYNRRPKTQNYNYLEVLISYETDWETKLIALQQLQESISFEPPLYKTLEGDLLALVKSEYTKLSPQLQNPVPPIIKNILEVYCESLRGAYSRLIQNLFLKINVKIKFTFSEKFDKEVKDTAVRYWKSIDSDNLELYLRVFEIRELIQPESLIPKIKNFLKNGGPRIERAANYISILGLHSQFDIKDLVKQLCQEKLINALIKLIEKDPSLQNDAIKILLANKNAKNASDIVKEFRLNPHDFPTLIPTLKRQALRYYMRDADWMQVEEKFFDSKQIEGFLAEELILSGKWDEALSIVKRHNLLEKEEYLSKEFRDKIIPYFSNSQKPFKYLENNLFKLDAFEPTEEILGLAQKGTYLHLRDFGYDLEKDFMYIDDCESQDFQRACDEIMQAGIIGFDSEFKFNTTRFEISRTATLQIATEKKLYILDSMRMIKSKKYNDFIFNLLKDPGLQIVGHTLSADLTKIRESNEDKEKLEITGTIDISKIFRSLYPNNKYSLAAICEHYTKRKMSKYEQLSNWENRPLRKAQLHYAVFDAVIVLKLLNELKKDLIEKGLTIDNVLDEQANKDKKKRNEDEDEESEEVETEATDEESKDNEEKEKPGKIKNNKPATNKGRPKNKPQFL